FMSEEQLALDYIEINRRDLAADIEIDETELQAQYQQLVAGFEGRDARDAAHILIALSAERDAEQAKTEAQELRLKINQGADFAELAKEYSDDGGSAIEGGALGLVEQGVMVAEFEQALFALQVGEVSEPVSTEFGYHLIKLNRIDKSTPPRFDSVRAELEFAQREQKSETRFVELSEALADLSFSAGDLQEPSEQLELPISHTALIGREGGEDAFSADPRVLKAAFSKDVLSKGHNSELIELSRDQVAVIRLREHQPASAQTLAEVREQILAALKQQKAEQQVQERAAVLLAEAKALSAEQLSASPWQQQDGVSRSEAALDPLQVRALFKMPKPAAGQLSWAQVKLSDGSAAVMGVTAVYPGAEPEAQALLAMSGYLANRNGQSNYASLKQHLKASAAIVR
ncbi:MAG: peptidyl-prolyl cis-trans isomerase D, partial [Motiliproteus sp.]